MLSLQESAAHSGLIPAVSYVVPSLKLCDSLKHEHQKCLPNLTVMCLEILYIFVRCVFADHSQQRQRETLLLALDVLSSLLEQVVHSLVTPASKQSQKSDVLPRSKLSRHSSFVNC